MQALSLIPILHRGEERISLPCRHDAALNTIVKKLAGAKWSNTHKSWHLPLSEKSYYALCTALKASATIDNRQLKAYLQKRKQATGTSTVAQSTGLAKATPATAARKLSKENLAALAKFVQQLKLKAYSPSTIRTYRNEFMQLLQLLKNKNVEGLTPDDIRRYMVYAMEKEHIKENTAHSRLNALKFYFEQVLGREKFFWDIPRPKKPLILPKLLNEDELRRLFNALSNKKHKAMLFTAYSAGLRVSEIVNLKLRDVDSRRMQIFV
ncbi:MAG: phage integrase N-terminal SAM-like domain-containing protein, partial [Bacteroidetes bacterium]|nr:phage integrase N-terminal SAM-like domain-containing protein [Bacteroidota bacterium]